MIKEELVALFERDLNKLLLEIESFKDEKNLWKVAGSIKNPGGNLCLHLLGNLNTYIGKNLGNSNYVRNRDAEFSTKDVPRADLINAIQNLAALIKGTLEELEEYDLRKVYPEEVLGYSMTVQYFLIHLLAHLSYHLGQINYLRRMLE